MQKPTIEKETLDKIFEHTKSFIIELDNLLILKTKTGYRVIRK